MHPSYLPSQNEARIARMWSRRLRHVKGFNASRCQSLAKKLDWYRRSGAGDFVALFLSEYDLAMAQAVSTAYRSYRHG